MQTFLHTAVTKVLAGFAESFSLRRQCVPRLALAACAACSLMLSMMDTSFLLSVSTGS